MDKEKHKVDWNPSRFVCVEEHTVKTTYSVPDTATCPGCDKALPSDVAVEEGWWRVKEEWEECPECRSLREMYIR